MAPSGSIFFLNLLERAAQQAAHLDLGDPELLRDLDLRHALQKAHLDDLALTRGEAGERLLDDDAVVGEGELLVLGRIAVDDRRRVVVLHAGGGLERDRAVRGGGLHGLEHLIDGRVEILGDLGDRGRALELGGQRIGGLVDLCRELLQAAGHANAPALVPKVALDLAHDGGRGERGELQAARRVEAVDGLEQAQIADLHEVVDGLPAVLEFVGDEAHQVEVGHDELFAGVDIALFLEATEELARLLLIPGALTRGLRCHRHPPSCRAPGGQEPRAFRRRRTRSRG